MPLCAMVFAKNCKVRLALLDTLRARCRPFWKCMRICQICMSTAQIRRKHLLVRHSCRVCGALCGVIVVGVVDDDYSINELSKDRATLWSAASEPRNIHWWSDHNCVCACVCCACVCVVDAWFLIKHTRACNHDTRTVDKHARDRSMRKQNECKNQETRNRMEYTLRLVVAVGCQ